MVDCDQGSLSLPPQYKVIKVLDGKFALYQCQPDFQFKSDHEGILWCNNTTGTWNKDNLAACKARDTKEIATNVPKVSHELTTTEAAQGATQEFRTSTSTVKYDKSTSSSTNQFTSAGVTSNTKSWNNEITTSKRFSEENTNSLWTNEKGFSTGVTEKTLLDNKITTKSEGLTTRKSEDIVTTDVNDKTLTGKQISSNRFTTESSGTWNDKITHPVEITTESRGTWNDKKTHPVEITTEPNGNTVGGNEISTHKGITTTKSDTTLLNSTTSFNISTTKDLEDNYTRQVTKYTNTVTPGTYETMDGDQVTTFGGSMSKSSTTVDTIDGATLSSSPSYIWVVILGSVAGFLVLLAISILLIHYVLKRRRKNENGTGGQHDSESKPEALVEANAQVRAFNRSLQSIRVDQSDITSSGSNLYQQILSTSGDSTSNTSQRSSRRVSGGDNPPLAYRYNISPNQNGTKIQNVSGDRDTLASLSSALPSSSKKRKTIPSFVDDKKDEFRVTASVADLDDEEDEKEDKNKKHQWNQFDPAIFADNQLNGTTGNGTTSKKFGKTPNFNS